MATLTLEEKETENQQVPLTIRTKSHENKTRNKNDPSYVKSGTSWRVDTSNSISRNDKSCVPNTKQFRDLKSKTGLLISNRDDEMTKERTKPPNPNSIHIAKPNIKPVKFQQPLGSSNAFDEKMVSSCTTVETVRSEFSELELHTEGTEPKFSRPKSFKNLTSMLESDVEPDTQSLETDAAPITPSLTEPDSHLPQSATSSTNESFASQGSPMSLASSGNASSPSPSMPSSSFDSSLCHNARKQRRDILIIHTESPADLTLACEYKEHLESDAIGVKELTVDVFGCVCSGKSNFGFLNEVSVSYNSVLLLVTDDLCKCDYTKYLNECLMTLGLTTEGANTSLVIPIWSKDHKMFAKLPVELFPLRNSGFKYCDFGNPYKFIKNCYVKKVQDHIQKRRDENS